MMEELNHLKKTKKELIKELQQFYYKKAAPLLPNYETKRNTEKYNVYAIYVILTGFILTIMSQILVKEVAFAGMLLILAGTAVIALHKGNKGSSTITIEMDFEKKLKDKLMKDFLNIFGDFSWSKYSDGKLHTITTDFVASKIFPITHLFTFDDIIEGNYSSIDLRIYEMKTGFKALNLILVLIFLIVLSAATPIYVIVSVIIISVVSGLFSIIGSSVGVFTFFILLLLAVLIPIVFLIRYLIISDSLKCLVIEFDIPKHFKGNTFLYEKALTNKKLFFKKKDGMKKVSLEDVVFNSMYEVYSTDQIEARYLLTTAFIDRFKKIRTAFKAEYIRAEFVNDKLTILLGVEKDLFAMGSISKKTTSRTFVELFEEIYSVLSLVDTLQLDQNTGL